MKTRILLVALALVLQSTQASDGQPPQLLGVWHGTYNLTDAGQTRPAQMWMLISSQTSQDGWTVAGHNRWNILDQVGKQLHTADSKGRHAEYFDQLSGRIASDGRSVRFVEKTTGNRIEAILSSENRMDANVYSERGNDAMFRVTLDRIRNHYSPDQTTVLGIDVSHHSGSVDWDKVKTGHYQFAYVKASEGVDDPDAMFDQHWQALAQSGLARGAYHFYVTEDDPVQQAQFFASRIKSDPGNLPPAVDVELLGANTTGDMTETLLTFLQTLEGELGVKPVIYTSSTFWDSHYEPVFSDYQLWLAEYGVELPRTPFGWDNWLFWQHAADQSVDGVEKSADINLLHPDRNLNDLIEQRP